MKLVQDKLRTRDEEILNTLRAEFPVVVDESALSTVHVDLSDAGTDPDSGGEAVERGERGAIAGRVGPKGGAGHAFRGRH